MVFKSGKTKEQLIKSFDEHTAAHRFAGSDDILDDIYISKRKGNKVFLAHRPRNVHDLFATVFRGRIVELPEGSAIKGIFTVGIFDYLLVLLAGSAYGYIIYEIYARAHGRNAAQTIGLVLLGLAVAYLALRTGKKAKDSYKELLEKIAEY